MLDLDDDDDKNKGTASPSLDKAPAAQGANQADAGAPNRFMNMIYSFTGFITRRKQ